MPVTQENEMCKRTNPQRMHPCVRVEGHDGTCRDWRTADEQAILDIAQSEIAAQRVAAYEVRRDASRKIQAVLETLERGARELTAVTKQRDDLLVKHNAFKRALDPEGRFLYVDQAAESLHHDIGVWRGRAEQLEVERDEARVLAARVNRESEATIATLRDERDRLRSYTKSALAHAKSAEEQLKVERDKARAELAGVRADGVALLESMRKGLGL